jgi:cysteine desulfurase
MKRIYLDNAATTQILPEVVKTMTDVLNAAYGNPSSTHTEGRQARSIIERARKSVAESIGASIGEIFFTSGGTESNNMAIKNAVRDLGVRRIITSKIEHHCVLHSVEQVHLTDKVNVAFVDNDHTGRIDLSHLEKVLSSNPELPTLVSIMHANNEIGTINPIAEIGEICKRTGAYFHSDTVQTVGHFPIDVSKLNVHFISGAAHKFHGPKGIGFVYINSDVHIKPFIDGGAQERNMRGGTENISGIAGLANALELSFKEMERHRQYIQGLKDYFWTKLKSNIPDIIYHGCPENSLYTVLNIGLPPNPKNEMLLMLLDIQGVSASGGSACSSGSEKPSHVIQALNSPLGTKAVRFSFSQFNTRSEIDRVIELLTNIYAPEPKVFTV